MSGVKTDRAWLLWNKQNFSQTQIPFTYARLQQNVSWSEPANRAVNEQPSNQSWGEFVGPLRGFAGLELVCLAAIFCLCEWVVILAFDRKSGDGV